MNVCVAHNEVDTPCSVEEGGGGRVIRFMGRGYMSDDNTLFIFPRRLRVNVFAVVCAPDFKLMMAALCSTFAKRVVVPSWRHKMKPMK